MAPLPMYARRWFLGGHFDSDVHRIEPVPEHSTRFRSPGRAVKFPNAPVLWSQKRQMKQL